MTTGRRTMGLVLTTAMLGLLVAVSAAPAEAGQQVCGVSSSHTVCVTLPDVPTDENGVPMLTGEQTVTVTVSPNSGKLYYTWIPDGAAATTLMLQSKAFSDTRNYSFTWPTWKYFDALGTLRLQSGSTSAAAIDVPVHLSNGNVVDFARTPADWSFSTAWTGESDPLVAAVGDGPDGTKVPNQLEASIEAHSPALFLFLGDVYETGTFTENLNHYGRSALDDPLTATMWGRMARITQPTVGNHEYANLTAWTDYWHGRPDYLYFDFAGVRFFDLDANKPFSSTGAQYAFVRDHLAPVDPTAPACVVAYWHQPIFYNGKTTTKMLPMWKLLAGAGGDLVINAHIHSMAQYLPMDQNGQVSETGHMVELMSGAGGHGLTGTMSDSRLEWALGSTAGALYVTLVGGSSGAASQLSWSFQDVAGNVLHTGSVAC